MSNVVNFPVAQLPVDPFLHIFAHSAGGMGTVEGSNGNIYGFDQLFTAMGVDFCIGDELHQAWYIILNALDAPLTLSGDFLEGHGHQYMQPAILRFPKDAPDVPVAVTENVIPGRVEAMIPDTPDDAWGKVTSDVDTFGVGIFRTGREGLIYGTGAAMAFTTTDPRVTSTIALAGCVSAGGGEMFQAVKLDLTDYGTLQAFYDKTVNAGVPEFIDSANDVMVMATAMKAGIDTTSDTYKAGWEQSVVFLYYIGPPLS